MKRIATVIAALSLLSAVAAAQNYTDIEISSGNKVESKLRLVFPMHFGLSTLVNPTYNGPWASTGHGQFLNTQLYRNFNYGIEPIGLRFYSKKSPFEFGLGIRLSFMDYCLENPALSFHPVGGDYVPYEIVSEQPSYNGTKSKIHASYVGVPLRFFFKAGKAKLYSGVSAEYMFNGYTKYREPKARVTTNELFNRLRAGVEVGATYGIIGVFASYSFSPLFDARFSNATVFSFGLTLGM